MLFLYVCIGCQFAFQSLFTELFSEFEFNKNDLLFFLRPVFIGTFSTKQTSLKNVHMPEKSCYKKPQRDSPWKVLLYSNVSMDWDSKALYLYPYLFFTLLYYFALLYVQTQSILGIVSCIFR